MVRALALLLGSSLAFADLTADNPKPCESGKTTLRIREERPKIPRHDQSLGTTWFELVPRDGKEALQRVSLEDDWRCVGFNTARGYILDGRWESGVIVALRALRYWPESAEKPIISRFEREQQAAAAWVWSSDLRYFAFISLDGRLKVLDTKTDRIRDLAKAPAPPPIDENTRETLKNEGASFDWISVTEQIGYDHLDPGILSLEDNHILKASYGKDTANARAKKRTVRTWDLGSLFH
jgi:hypothetical protein